MNTILKQYTITSSGVKMLHDRADTLEIYFNDIYHLFLNRLVKITHDSDFTQEDRIKLTELFEELVKIKTLLQATS